MKVEQMSFTLLMSVKVTFASQELSGFRYYRIDCVLGNDLPRDALRRPFVENYENSLHYHKSQKNRTHAGVTLSTENDFCT